MGRGKLDPNRASFAVFTVRLCVGKELRSQRGNLVAGLRVSSVAAWAGTAESTLELVRPLRRDVVPAVTSCCTLQSLTTLPRVRFTAVKGMAHWMRGWRVYGCSQQQGRKGS